jgi:hypothetical protein
MKNFLTTLAVILLPTTLAFGDSNPVFWGDSVGGFSVGIVVSNSVYPLDAPVPVTVHVRNDSTTPNHIAVQPLEYFLSFIATDEARRQLRPKPVPADISGISGFPLPPGAIHSETVDLRNYLFLTNAGKIVLTVKWLVERTTFAFSGNAVMEIAGSPKETTEAGNPINSTAKNPFTTAALAEPMAPTAAGNVSVVSKPGTARPLAHTTTISNAHSFSSAQKVSAVIIVGLLAVLLAILWRAARRKPEA